MSLTACSASPSAPAPAPRHAAGASASELLEPTPSRLQDLAGQFLLYYTRQHRLPARVEDLNTVAVGGKAQPAIDPESNRPFLYVPAGLELPAGRGRVLLYQPQPSPQGRWALVLGAGQSNPKSDQPGVPLLYVARVPEDLLQAALPK